MATEVTVSSEETAPSAPSEEHSAEVAAIAAREAESAARVATSLAEGVAAQAEMEAAAAVQEHVEAVESLEDRVQWLTTELAQRPTHSDLETLRLQVMPPSPPTVEVVETPLEELIPEASPAEELMAPSSESGDDPLKIETPDLSVESPQHPEETPEEALRRERRARTRIV